MKIDSIFVPGRSCQLKVSLSVPPLVVQGTSGSFVRPCPQCTPPARRRAPRQHAKGAAAAAVLRRRRQLRGQLCRANIVRFSPCRQPLGVSLCRAGQPAFRSFAAVSVSSGPSPADVAVAVCFSGIAFFLCRGRKKRGVLSIKHNNPYRGAAKRRLFPSINIIIFNTGIHVSAPYGRQSCRREHSSLHPRQG